MDDEAVPLGFQSAEGPCDLCNRNLVELGNLFVKCGGCGATIHQNCQDPRIRNRELVGDGGWSCVWCKAGKPSPYGKNSMPALESAPSADGDATMAAARPEGVATRSSRTEVLSLEERKAIEAEERKLRLDQAVAGQWYGQLMTEKAGYVKGSLEHSGKLLITLFIIQAAAQRGEKVIVFSQSLHTLGMIEALTHDVFGFKKGRDYFTLTGSTKHQTRQRNINEFNSAGAKQRLYLVSTQAGSLGVNMVGANRVIIFDASWNPAQDQQAIFRAYRFGQTKTVYIYRLVADGTMESKIYQRQMTKQGMSLRVLDEHQADSAFSMAEIQALWSFNDDEADDPDYKSAADALVAGGLTGSSSGSGSEPRARKADKHAQHTTAPKDAVMREMLERFEVVKVAEVKEPQKDKVKSDLGPVKLDLADAGSGEEESKPKPKKKKPAKKKAAESNSDLDSDSSDDEETAEAKRVARAKKVEDDAKAQADAEEREKQREAEHAARLAAEAKILVERAKRRKGEAQKLLVKGKWIIGYHVPAALLEDMDSLHLTEAEQQQALQEFEMAAAESLPMLTAQQEAWLKEMENAQQALPDIDADGSFGDEEKKKKKKGRDMSFYPDANAPRRSRKPQPAQQQEEPEQLTIQPRLSVVIDGRQEQLYEVPNHMLKTLPDEEPQPDNPFRLRTSLADFNTALRAAEARTAQKSQERQGLVDDITAANAAQKAKVDQLHQSLLDKPERAAKVQRLREAQLDELRGREEEHSEKVTQALAEAVAKRSTLHEMQVELGERYAKQLGALCEAEVSEFQRLVRSLRTVLIARAAEHSEQYRVLKDKLVAEALAESSAQLEELEREATERAEQLSAAIAVVDARVAELEQERGQLIRYFVALQTRQIGLLRDRGYTVYSPHAYGGYSMGGYSYGGHPAPYDYNALLAAQAQMAANNGYYQYYQKAQTAQTPQSRSRPGQMPSYSVPAGHQAYGNGYSGGSSGPAAGSGLAGNGFSGESSGYGTPARPGPASYGLPAQGRTPASFLASPQNAQAPSPKVYSDLSRDSDARPPLAKHVVDLTD